MAMRSTRFFIAVLGATVMLTGCAGMTDQEQRSAYTLLRIAGLKYPRRSRPERTEVPVTQDELATMVQLSRTTLVQVLRRFERCGLIEQGYRTLRIIDVPGLTAVESDH